MRLLCGVVRRCFACPGTILMSKIPPNVLNAHSKRCVFHPITAIICVSLIRTEWEIAGVYRNSVPLLAETTSADCYRMNDDG